MLWMWGTGFPAQTFLLCAQFPDPWNSITHISLSKDFDPVRCILLLLERPHKVAARHRIKPSCSWSGELGRRRSISLSPTPCPKLDVSLKFLKPYLSSSTPSELTWEQITGERSQGQHRSLDWGRSAGRQGALYWEPLVYTLKCSIWSIC